MFVKSPVSTRGISLRQQVVLTVGTLLTDALDTDGPTDEGAGADTEGDTEGGTDGLTDGGSDREGLTDSMEDSDDSDTELSELLLDGLMLEGLTDGETGMVILMVTRMISTIPTTHQLEVVAGYSQMAAEGDLSMVVPRLRSMVSIPTIATPAHSNIPSAKQMNARWMTTRWTTVRQIRTARRMMKKSWH